MKSFQTSPSILFQKYNMALIQAECWKGYENYEKVKENVLRTKRAVYELDNCDRHSLPDLTWEEKFLRTSD